LIRLKVGAEEPARPSAGEYSRGRAWYRPRRRARLAAPPDFGSGRPVRRERRPPPVRGAFNPWEKTMNSKILASAVVVAAAVLAIWGCASKPIEVKSSPFDCTSNACDVGVGNRMLGEVDVPEAIVIKATSSTTVTITWSLHSWWGVTFNPDGGINMKEKDSPFKCAAVNAKQWTCTAKSGLESGKRYYYGLKFHGAFRPYDVDPYIQN
jgi:hypothetical protein